MKIIAPLEACTGCFACAQKCPTQSIHINEQADGFLYPEIAPQSCVDCGLCRKVCPVLHEKEKRDAVKAYVAYSKDEAIRRNSSSGGLFSELAKAVLAKGGTVYGAAFDAEMNVHHVGITQEADLHRLQGSKYVQSTVGNTFKEAECLLKQGREVLFSGTPCQIAGLEKFLEKDYSNLYTVDILCHGVPSAKLWKHYIAFREAEHRAKIQRTFFRNKNHGWKKFSMELQFENSTTYIEEFPEDPFMQMFLRNICLRSSCYECRFKDLDRPSDLTIGDAWGIETYMPEMDDDFGTSVVLTHSPRGEQILNSIRDRLEIRETGVELAVPPTADSRKSVEKHRNHDLFFAKLNSGCSINRLIKLTEAPLTVRVKRRVLRCGSKVKHMLLG